MNSFRSFALVFCPSAFLSISLLQFLTNELNPRTLFTAQLRCENPKNLRRRRYPLLCTYRIPRRRNPRWSVNAIVDSRRGNRPDSSPSIPKIRTPSFCFSRATRTLPHPFPQADSPGRINIDSLLQSLSLSLYENSLHRIHYFLDSCQVSSFFTRQMPGGEPRYTNPS